MATSGSAEDRAEWTAGVRAFSGRPDPTWEPGAEVVTALLGAWESLAPATAEVAPPPLGYQGSFLRHADGREWTAYRGVVTLQVGRAAVKRGDPLRRFERTLLGSAPSGLLPSDLGGEAG